MTRTEIQIVQDGKAIPGFPYVREQEFRQFFSLWNKITSLAAYANALPVFTPLADAYIGLFILHSNCDLLVAIRDAPADVPFTLPAGNILALVGGIMIHNAATPIVQIKGTVLNQVAHVTAGVL